MATKAINSLHVTYISTTPFRTGSEQVEARPPATPVSILYCYGISALLLRVGRRVGYLIPNILPTLFRRPDLVVGMPVALAIFLFAEVMPSALFQLNESPGILNFFFAINISSLLLLIY